MVRDDDFWLAHWIRYYSALFGSDCLYVIQHGSNADVSALASTCNNIRIPARGQHDTVGQKFFNRHRAELVQGLANGLLRYYDLVVYTDVDEFVVLDPSLGTTLPEYLIQNKNSGVISPFGLDLVHVTSQDSSDLSRDGLVLSSRHFARIASGYTKPIAISTPVRWEGGFHHADFPRLFIPAGLYCFHLKWADRRLSLATHYARSQNKVGQDALTNDRSHLESFPLRERVEGIFAQYNHAVIDKDFDFKWAIDHYQQTWRRRRFLFQGQFWRSLIGHSEYDYIRYWRFSHLEDSRLFEIPLRFRTLF